MRRMMIFIVLIVSTASPATAGIYCTNCSTRFMQALDRVTNLDQLAKLAAQYDEDLKQTYQQITMVQQNIESLANMARNTLNLDPATLRMLQNRFVSLGQLVVKMSHQKGEADTLDRVYRTLYPSRDELGREIRYDTDEANEAALRRYQDWSDQVDAASMATFQMSGSQLEELAGSEEFDAHVQRLLNSPEGRMQALQSANQLSAMQLDENRKLRALLATSIQATAQVNAKAEKQDQSDAEWWRSAFESDAITDQLNASPNPPPMTPF